MVLGFAVQGKTLLLEEESSQHFQAQQGFPGYPKTQPHRPGGSSPLCLPRWASVKIKGFEWSHMWVFSLPRHVTLQ